MEGNPDQKNDRKSVSVDLAVIPSLKLGPLPSDTERSEAAIHSNVAPIQKLDRRRK
jgi:hypothetical protein